MPFPVNKSQPIFAKSQNARMSEKGSGIAKSMTAVATTVYLKIRLFDNSLILNMENLKG